MKIASIQRVHLTSEPFTIKYNSNEVGDTSTPETYLEVTNLPEDAEVDAIGFTLEDSVGTAMKFADISNLGTADTIASDGIYLILSGALEKLVISCTNECDVIIKQVI